MIYKLKLVPFKDKFIERVFHQSMKDLGKFYGINWIRNKPKIMLVKNRREIDLLKSNKTEPWLVAWADSNARIVFILDPKNFEKQSSHRYSHEHYAELIKHEISHLFYNILSSYKRGPVWLSEGTALYTAGQNKTKIRPKRFENFLTFYNKGGQGVYAEPGFAIELMVQKFGKYKLLELIKSLTNVNNEKKFNQIFYKIYGIRLSYKSINNLLKKSNPLGK